LKSVGAWSPLELPLHPEFWFERERLIAGWSFCGCGCGAECQDQCSRRVEGPLTIKIIYNGSITIGFGAFHD